MFSNKKDKKLFGTDGIRGLANSFPITPDLTLRLGQAIGYLLKKKYPNKSRISVLIGKDTRLSGYMLEQALASGLNSMGIWVQLTGPLPTPGIGFLVQNMRYDSGIIISASHNPYLDNGIKIFDKKGFKISKEEEKKIEELIFSDKDFSHFTTEVGRTKRIVDSTGRYIVFVKNTFPLNMDLDGMKLVLDCANGSAYKIGPKIFEELGADLILTGDKPNGFNINKKSGAMYPEKMIEKVIKEGADGGISFDGDGDRLIMSDETGAILNGDHVLGICAIYLKEQNKLMNNKVVGTHTSNTGLEESLKEHGIEMIRTDIGDRNVIEMMKKENIQIGGESSGHIIFLDQSTTGDASIAALKMMEICKVWDKKLSELRKMIKEKPSLFSSIKIKKRLDLNTLTGYLELLTGVKDRLGKGSRILIRYSGTEALLRILLESDNIEAMKKEEKKLSSFLEKHLN